MTFETCLGCHGDPKNAPAPVKEGYLPDRHHLRVDTPISDYTDSPFPNEERIHKCVTCHKVDWVDDPSRPLGGYFLFAEEPTSPQFRNCLNCHDQKKNEDGRLIATVHHLTDKAQRKLCYQCHGSLVNNAATPDHRIPDPENAPDPDKARKCGVVTPDGDRNFYDISIVTPWPGDNYIEDYWKRMLDTIYGDCEDPNYGRRYYDPNVADGQFVIDPPRFRYEENPSATRDADRFTAVQVPDGTEGGRRTGNCEHCHFQGENPGDAVQPNTGLAKPDVGTNMDNHHATGVGQLGSGSVHTCSLCHAPMDPPNYNIRGCELCHGISTVHAIEFDANGDGIQVGEEVPFMGHIGNDINCRGCHLNFRTGSVYQANDSLGSIPPGYQGPVPDVTSMSVDGMIAGTATDLTITGSGFYVAMEVNGRTVEAIPHIELVGSDGSVTEIALDRANVTETSIDVTIPASLKPDTYELYVVKGEYDPESGGQDYSQRSAARPFLVAPTASIDSVSCSAGKVTITGSGFGDTYIAGSHGMGVLGDGSSCSVESWSDTQIVANCGSGTGTVTVDGLFGEASSDAACGGTDDSGRPKWWSIWSWWSSWSWARR